METSAVYLTGIYGWYLDLICWLLGEGTGLAEFLVAAKTLITFYPKWTVLMCLVTSLDRLNVLPH